jgi:hypothetical protein
VSKILLVTPTYNGTIQREVGAMLAHAQIRTKQEVIAWSGETSFLTFQFNKFWCLALNDKNISHFVMLHADVCPADVNWMNKLISIADSKNADVLSAVCRLKREDGATSTAIAKKGAFGNYQRLTLKNVQKLPETFNVNHVADFFQLDPADSNLLINTGCMVVRMSNRKALETMRFTVNNWIARDEETKQFYPVSEPEDWEWSTQAANKGLSVWATRAVAVTHVGVKGYDSEEDTGLEFDPGDGK